MKFSPAFWLLLASSTSCQVVLDLSDRHAAADDAGDVGGTGGDASSSVGGATGGDGSLESSAGGTGGALFAYRFGDSKNQRVDGFVIDEAGGVVMYGVFNGTLDFGDGVTLNVAGGIEQTFIARFHPDGSIEWARQAEQTWVSSAAISSTRTALVGNFDGVLSFGSGGGPAAVGHPDIFLALFEYTGSLKIAKTFPGTAVDPQFVALGGQDVIMGGSFVYSIDFAGTTSPLVASPLGTYVAKLDLNGDGVWARDFPDCPNLEPRAIARAPNGMVALAAEFSEACKLGDVVVASAPGLTTTDCLIATLDAEQGIVTHAVAVGAPHCEASAVAFTSDFGVALLGAILGTSTKYPALQGDDQDVFGLALAIDLATPEQVVRLPRNGVDRSTTLRVDIRNRMFAAGQFASGTLVAELDPNGPVWSRELGAPTPIENSFVVGDLTSITVAGTLTGSADFGNGTVSSAGDGDVFLVRYPAP